MSPFRYEALFEHFVGDRFLVTAKLANGSGTFTEEAVKWAKGKPVFLIDGQSLEQMAAKYETET